MSTYKSDFVRTLVERGFMHQCTDLEALDELAARQQITAYIGYDCTAPSLHVGSLVQIMMQRHLQKTGHRPIVLMGGGTTKVGDPSGKDASRKLLSDDDINDNMTGIREVFSRFVSFGDGATDAVMVNNDDWLSELAYIPFLRDMGRHFSINRMLSFESVKLRLEREQPLSFLEFNYMILQAYDFLELNRRHDCVLQMGGSDQWGNIVNGVELGRRVDSAALYGFTTPLITLASGAKMGKTADGAVWLNKDMLSAYDYWQFWRNTEDADVGRFLRLFTELPLDEIARLDKLEGAEINAAKIILAGEATTLCHGAEAAKAAENTARQTFAEGRVATDLPTVEVKEGDLKSGAALYELMVLAGLCKSNGEARRLIKAGGARVNDAQISEEMAKVTLDEVTAEGVIKLSAGKKRHVLVRPA
ncbi:MAG: tyrosine--tRNA ligase [Rhodospirillaceae bacterium]|jgi:tyrosyl-tRNA synthetase|nr:tyrosine--tRNA ligase [Rhodospirillaceae bacterium]MBT4691178.1 tyrosine--tRNA ligase [Rhodospirillaceae bacterium]MBT5081093.1 tyrosine--tRNA ligase [Rhodospirillaceae bacterium]MBT5524620.1 tyrosine--tRNA ligase [Rhodospirillaceae bacterium]MBT6591338.1 tyrosine--tRNA ligase [Rhodospirillaceae bacterium]